MKTFVVAHTNFFDNDLTQEIVTADTPEEAIWKHSKLLDPCWEHLDAGDNVEDIEEYLFNSDILASVIEIPIS
jgi:hypothetical protein